MHVRSKLIRVLKFLGKALVGLLLVFIMLILLLHVPAVQKIITRKAAGFLSAKTHATVAIERIRFSLRGSLVIEGVNAVSYTHLTLPTSDLV